VSIAETFENVAGYEKEHAADRPMDQGWQESMTSNDVVSSQDLLSTGRILSANILP